MAGWVGQENTCVHPAGEDRGHGRLQRGAGGLPGVQGEAHHKAGAQAPGKVWRASHAEAQGVPGESSSKEAAFTGHKSMDMHT